MGDMADMVNNDYIPDDGQDPQPEDYITNNKTMTELKHDFAVQSVKTANKDNKKYLGKDGTQAWRVTTKIGEDWYACMIYEEEFLPKKGKDYNIKLSENEGYKNWEYKLLTKKEQMKEQVAPPIKQAHFEEKPDWDKIAEGKVRHGVCVAYIEANRTLNAESKKEMNEWVNYIITGL